MPSEFLNVGDLYSVNSFVTGSNREAPWNVDAQILPLPSTSTVPATNVGPSIVFGGVYTCSVCAAGSTSIMRPGPLASTGAMLNQIWPFASRIAPWPLAAMPCSPSTRKNFVSPVLASTRPRLAYGFGTFTENQMLPSRSAWASCTPCWPQKDVGVPSNQSLPLLSAYFFGASFAPNSGTSYSVKTTRAASPDGRGRSLYSLMELGSGPRARAR